MKKTIILLCLALLSWGAYAQHDHGSHGAHNAHSSSTSQSTPSFKDKNLGTAYDHYIHLKNALVTSNFADAKKASTELVKSLNEVKDASKVQPEAEKVAGATSLANQRKAFTALSNEMVKLIKGGKLASGNVNLAYCSMANNNTGGSWLSNEKEIRNPYYGDRMLKCGVVKETIQ